MDTITYSQSSLQDFEECSRRFQLRYVERLQWPAVQTEPLLEYERHLERGARFHRLVERHQLGLPESLLTASIDDPQLLAWWQAYQGFTLVHSSPGERFPEYVLSAAVGSHRLVAKFDLLLVEPERSIMIVDWKTYPRSPGRARLDARIQTHVYPYVVLASGRFPWAQPEMVKMVYWIAALPAEPVVFEIDSSIYARDRALLERLLARIESFSDDPVWPLTSDERACRYCVYRSLCARGSEAARLEVDPEGLFMLGDDGDGGDWVLDLDSVEGNGF